MSLKGAAASGGVLDGGQGRVWGEGVVVWAPCVDLGGRPNHWAPLLLGSTAGIAPEAIRCNCPVLSPQLPQVHTLGSLSAEGEKQPGCT